MVFLESSFALSEKTTKNMQIINSKKEYDAIVVGSGAGGGMAAFIMANSGMIQKIRRR